LFVLGVLIGEVCKERGLWAQSQNTSGQGMQNASFLVANFNRVAEFLSSSPFPNKVVDPGEGPDHVTKPWSSFCVVGACVFILLTLWNSESQKKPLTRIPQVLGVLKKTKHENIYTIPNILTFSRLVAAPVVGWLVLHDYHAWAFGLFAYAGITDLVDGYIARRWNLQTVVGTVIDPMADKTLMTILTVCLAVKGALPSK